MDNKYRNWLKALTGIPTAAGCEDRVIEWIKNWTQQRKWASMQVDKFGNVLLRRSAPGATRSRKPIIFTAHMDHPAFVVTDVVDAHHVRADFRGGVHDAYFMGTRVLLHQQGKPPRPGLIEELTPAGPDGTDKQVTARFFRQVKAKPGEVMTWDTGPVRIVGNRLHAPACDDLSAVAAGLAAFDSIHTRRGKKPDVRLLLTRAEEVGFIGAIGACKSGIIPKLSRLITLENSRSFSESPIGGGPIVRVGDRTSSFDPDLTYQISKVAEALGREDSNFKWQRKLMPGGTCEASAFQSYGYRAACVCLPLGNYHNMGGLDDSTPQAGKVASAPSRRGADKPRIKSEIISMADFQGLLRLLVKLGLDIDKPTTGGPLKKRLDKLFAKRKGLLK